MSSEMDEEDIHEAFISTQSSHVADIHSHLIDPSHRYFSMKYAYTFRKFRWSCKTIPDYEDDFSRSLENDADHRQMVDFRHPNFDAEYNLAFHTLQESRSSRRWFYLWYVFWSKPCNKILIFVLVLCFATTVLVHGKDCRLFVHHGASQGASWGS